MPDKRDECGCHRDCEWLVHDCLRPCRFPACLTEDEHAQLLVEILRANGIVECAKGPDGRHVATMLTNPMTGLPFKACRNCGQELA